MLHLRLIFGPLMIALLAGVIWADLALEAAGFPLGMPLFALAALAAGLAGRELAVMLRARGVPISGGQAAGCGWLGLSAVMAAHWAAPYLGQAAISLPVLAVCLAVLGSALSHASGRRPEGALAHCGAGALACTWLGLMPGLLLMLRVEHGVEAMGAVVLIVKSCDIGAYFTGRALGRHKLIPWLSPGKTKEGLVGGMLLSAAVATGFAWLDWLPLGQDPTGLITAALFGAAMGLLGQGGDLMASLLKRDAGVKDSGQTIPGFGGVIDVVDSPFATAPIAWAALALLASA